MKNSILFRRPVSSCSAGIPCVWLLCALIFLLFVQLSGNFHTVVAGELYRSSQPSEDELESYVQDKGIKSIINLRGADNADWYRQETAAAERLGVEHIDFKMSATSIVSAEQADKLVAIMKVAPKPILIHCRSGSDRTGIASAIYLQEIAGIAPSIAERQISFYYGHIAIPYLSPAYAMDESWEQLSSHFRSKDGIAAKTPASNQTAVLLATAISDDGRDR